MGYWTINSLLNSSVLFHYTDLAYHKLMIPMMTTSSTIIIVFIFIIFYRLHIYHLIDHHNDNLDKRWEKHSSKVNSWMKNSKSREAREVQMRRQSRSIFSFIFSKSYWYTHLEWSSSPSQLIINFNELSIKGEVTVSPILSEHERWVDELNLLSSLLGPRERFETRTAVIDPRSPSSVNDRLAAHKRELRGAEHKVSVELQVNRSIRVMNSISGPNFGQMYHENIIKVIIHYWAI